MLKTPLLLELKELCQQESSREPSCAPFLFLRSLINNPLKVGAIAPSSPKLSRLMASCVDVETAPVLEIGAGTGVITRALLRKGINPQRLFVIEQDASLASFLRRQFPQVRIHCGEALDARCILAEEAFSSVKTVVSSLPLRNLPMDHQIETVRAMVSVLAPEGQLIQFTYGAGCPIPSRKVGLQAERLGRVWMNFPPAAVWRFTRNETGV